MPLAPGDPSQSNAFSAATELEVRRLAGDECWVCGCSNPQICHVITEKELNVQHWTEIGLMNFTLESAANAIPLCRSCRHHFSSRPDPRFFFIPIDLQFFINFELRDRVRRSADGSLHRQAPTSVMYKLHLLREGKIPADASGGIYRRIFLKDYFANAGRSVEELGITTPKSWHGAPMAAMQRAFFTLWRCGLSALDEETIFQLRRLRDLYFRSTEDNPINLAGHRLLPASQFQTGSRSSGDDDEQRANETSRLDSTRADNSDRMNADNQNVQHHYIYASEAEWVLGPESTAEEAVHRFAPVLNRGWALSSDDSVF